MKSKFVHLLKNPIFQLIVSFCFCISCFVILLYFVYKYPNAIDEELFIVGVRWGFYLFGLLYGVFMFGLCLIDFGKWFYKRKVEKDGSSNSKN